MTFSSATFLFLFLPLTVIAYFLTAKKYRNFTLLVASLIFYLWAEPIFIFLLLFLILTDYFAGLSIEKWRNRQKIQKVILVFSVLIHIGVLCLFKYQPLFFGIVADIFQEETPILEFALPLGLSIYTLQGLSYLLDLYWNKIKVQKNFINLAMYISFFPQLIAGPILRYSDISRSFVNRTITHTTLSKGYGMFIRGLAKKVLLADTMLFAWNEIHSLDTASLSAASAWWGIICFAFAIYFYFSGYSDMARGIAKIFGFDIPNNFNYPYIAKSITEFWRRFNISLTVWLKTYLFSHVASRTSSFVLAVIKLLGLWGLIGLWYGGGSNFLLWGFFLGTIIIIEQLFLSSILEKTHWIIQRVYTFFIVLLSWVIFAMNSLDEMMAYYRAMFTGTFADDTFVYFLKVFSLPLLLAIIVSLNFSQKIAAKCENRYPKIMSWVNIGWELLLTVVCILFVISGIPDQQAIFISL